MTLHQDPKAWREGFDAGVAGEARACPYAAGTIEAWSWQSGKIEGDAIMSCNEYVDRYKIGLWKI